MPFWAGLILMMTVIFCNPIHSYADIEAGFFDEMEGGTIVGWGWDESNPDTPVSVRVTVTNQQTAEVVHDYRQTANLHRSDLEENSVGSGNHGFRIDVDWDALPDASYLIEGWAGSEKIPNTRTYTKGDPAKAAEEKTEASDQQSSSTHLTSLGVFRTTGYCPCRQCSEGYGRRTCTGAIATANHTIAVDPRVIPYGTKVMIGGTIYTAEDRGGAVKGNHIDIFFDTHAQTRQHGTRKVEVFLVS